jgi:hypothetical protein
VLACLIASGCAINPQDSPTYMQTDLLNRVHNGSAELSCRSPGCAFQYGYNRGALHQHYYNGEWKALAMKVVMLNYGIDQAYYYLGRAAEGMGDLEGALVFYRRSVAIARGTEWGQQCDAMINNCDGILLPQEALARITSVQETIAARVVPTPPAPVAPPAQSPPKMKRAKAPKKPSDRDVVGY